MRTLKTISQKIDMQKLMITVGMTLMEGMGIVLFFCGVFNIQIV